MPEIIIGTTNPAKSGMVRAALSSLQITLSDVGGSHLDIEEDGKTPQENARKKALAYAKAFQRPVLSIDNALYFEALPSDEQPGPNTRRVPGRPGRATDEELLAYYARKVDELGGVANGHWEFAVCIADGTGRMFEKTIVSPRVFVSRASARVIPGYPLESIQIEPRTGKYISEMTMEEQAAFWQDVIGKELCEFVQSVASQIQM